MILSISFNILFLILFLKYSEAFLIKQQEPFNATVFTTIIAKYPDSKMSSSQSLYLRGNNCNLTVTKGIKLKKISNDIWSTSLICPANVKITCKVLLNNTKWMMGMNYTFRLPQVSSTSIEIYPCFYPTTNPIIDTQPIYSAYLKNSRKLSIYYPLSFYDNPYKKYELVLLHDGQNLFDPSKAAFGVAWMCQNTTDLLITQGKIRQIIIVGIWNTPERNSEYTYSYDSKEKFGGKGDLYLNFIQKQLMPRLLDNQLKERVDGPLTIGGSSLGGLISCYATYSRPTIFQNSICMSSSFWWNNEDFNNIIIPSKSYFASTKIYLDSGDIGPDFDSMNETITVFGSLQRKGYYKDKNIFYYLDKGGQHNEYYWGKRFYVPLVDLFGEV